MTDQFKRLSMVVLAASAMAFAQSQTNNPDKGTAQEQKSAAAKNDKQENTKAATNKSEAKAEAQAAQADKPAENRRSVLDRPLGEKPDPIVVPAGTEIRVDIVDGKVLVPVRVGFATPIPALSKAAVQIERVYRPPVYDASGAVRQDSAYSSYAEYAVLSTITVDGVTYRVESNSVPLASPGSSAVTPDNSMGSSVHDVKFVLSTPLAIKR